MKNRLEELIKSVYREWRDSQVEADDAHPDEETLACFFENRLPEEENDLVCAHLISCRRCLDCIITQSGLQVSDESGPHKQLLERIKSLSGSANVSLALELALRVKEGLLGLLETNGDILVGQELMPASILRSRSIKEFKNIMTVLKDFQDVRIELKLEAKEAGNVNLTVIAKEKLTNELITDLRVTLIKDGVELESYITDTGSVNFEQVCSGSYSIEVFARGHRLAAAKLDIKK